MTRQEYISRLKTALKNAVKPSKTLHVECPDCETPFATDNGEWLIWCGDKEHAQALLDSSRAYLSLLESKEWAIVPVEPTDDMNPEKLNTEPECFINGTNFGLWDTMSSHAIYPEICNAIYKAMIAAAPTYLIGDKNDQ